jgi:hypothetical protein
MVNKLSNREISLMVRLFEYMTEDNLVYLYQQVSKRDTRSYVEKIAEDLRVSKHTVQSMISSIVAKQDVLRYFLYSTKSPIKGEYFISPDLCIKHIGTYDTIYKSIITKLEEGVVLTEG